MTGTALSGKKYKAYPEYRDSGVEWLKNIPFHWDCKKLKFFLNDLVRGPFGSALKKEFFTTSGMKVYEQKNCIQDSVILGDSYISEDIYCDLSRFTVTNGDLLMSCSGTIGKIVEITEPYEKGIINQALLIMRIDEGVVNKAFFKHIFRSEDVQKQIKDNTQGGAMQNLVATDIFKSVSFTIPSYKEQQKIAKFLDHETAKIDTLIAKQEKLIELLKEKRQAVISHAVTKGLNPDAPMRDSGVEWLGEVPEHWGSSTVKNLCYVNDGNHGEEYPTESDFVDNRDGVPFIRAGDFDNLKIIENDLRYISHKKNDSMRKGRLQEGDILFVNRGATIGKLCIVDAPYAGSNLNSQIAYLRCNTNLADHRYVTYFLSSPYIQTKILAAIQGGALPQYPLKHIVNLDIWHGNIEEQKAISNFLDNKTNKIKGLIEKSELAINLMKERKTALISAAVTGKIDVRDFVSEQGQPQGVQG